LYELLSPPLLLLLLLLSQDHDGSHIKGLIMNFLHHFYPSLLRIPGFLVEFITPIIKVKGKGGSAECVHAVWF
jgi:DNA gyrase/topoisomerase IV subunit B